MAANRLRVSLVFGTSLDVNIVIIAHDDFQNDRSAADAAVLGVFLTAYRTIDNDFDLLPATGALHEGAGCSVHFSEFRFRFGDADFAN